MKNTIMVIVKSNNNQELLATMVQNMAVNFLMSIGICYDDSSR